MKKWSIALAATLAVSFMTSTVHAETKPEEDLAAFQNYFKDRFKDVAFEEYKNGIYALNEDARAQWEEIEEFPPYEIGVDEGRELWATPFANGKGYKDCFGDDVSTIRGKYPFYDEDTDSIRTIEEDINNCRKENGEKPLKYKKGKIASLSAFIAYEGRDGKIDVQIPNEKAKAWYEKGKQFYYAKRGQLNMSCADCHVYNSGNFIRSEHLSPALGHPTHFPVYRSKWNALGTLHRRYAGCNQQVRAKALKPQSDEYKALEYFQAYMSNGLEWNGPGARK